MREQNKTENKGVVFPFFKGLMFPIEELIHHYQVFFCLAGVVSLCYSFITLLLGQNYICLFAAEHGGIFCLDNAYLSLLSLLLWVFMLAYFVNRWYLVTKCGMGVKQALFSVCWKKDFKTFGFIVVYFGLWLLIGVVFYWLKKRVATPDWVIELLYFTVGVLIVLSSFTLLLNSVLFVRFLQGRDWFVLKQTMMPIFDNLYKIVAYFMFYVLLLVYLSQYAKMLFLGSTILPLWISGLLGSTVEYMIACVMAVCFVASLEFQEKQIFYDKETNQK